MESKNGRRWTRASRLIRLETYGEWWICLEFGKDYPILVGVLKRWGYRSFRNTRRNLARWGLIIRPGKPFKKKKTALL